MPKPEDTRLDAAYSADDPEANKTLYRNWATTYDQGFAAESDYQPARLVANAYVTGGGKWPLLDVGCGTGLVAENLPAGAIVDGLDYSPEMLAVAKRKRIYQALIQADLNAALDIPHDRYAGFVSAGTFTIGHVGPQAIGSILPLVKSGGLCVISGNVLHYADANFEQALDNLVDAGQISRPKLSHHKIYGNAAGAPKGHADDEGFLLTFQRL